MRIGIDSYCYHRYFGEVYPDQSDPGMRWTSEDFLDRASELGVSGVSLESCFLGMLDQAFLEELKSILDNKGLERVFAWGHPDGLEGGRNEDAWRQMNSLIPKARALGAQVMRIVASSLKFRFEPHEPQIKAIVRLLKESVKIARDFDVILAIENHIDYTSSEILQILEQVNSDNLRVNFDTGNALRLMEDPVAAARRLGPYVVATHLKDVDSCRHVPPEEWFFFSSVPVGTGLIDIAGVIRELKNSGYNGMLAIETDHHKDNQDEDKLVEKSVAYLKKVLRDLNAG